MNRMTSFANLFKHKSGKKSNFMIEEEHVQLLLRMLKKIKPVIVVNDFC